MYAFLGHYNLFQAIEKYVTPKQTLITLQKLIDWSKELTRINDHEPEIKRETFTCYEGLKVQTVAKPKNRKLYRSKWRFKREQYRKECNHLSA